MKIISFFFLSMLFISCGNYKEGQTHKEIVQKKVEAVNLDSADVDIKIKKTEKVGDITSAESIETKKDKSISSSGDSIVQLSTARVRQSTFMSGMSQAMQGGAQFGDYVVYGANPTLRIYNLKTKTLDFVVVTKGLAANTDNHFNSMAFSNEFHTKGDAFPILYMASNNVKNLGISFGSAIYGVRIYMSGSKMKAQLVHTIKISGTAWIDIAMDTRNDFLWLRLNHGKYFRNVKIARPLSVQGDVSITLNPNNILSEFKTLREPFGRSSGQGSLFYNNKLYMTSGTGSQSGKERIMVINTITGKMEQIVDLRASGLKGEPEFIFRYDNRFFIAYRNGKFYEIVFKSQ